jgi:hypothetical protein
MHALEETVVQDLRVEFQLSPEDVLVLAVDMRRLEGDQAVFERGYFVGHGIDAVSQDKATLKQWDPGASFPITGHVPDNILIILYPTRTSSAGLGGSLFSDIAPEDRHMMRKVRRHFPGQISYYKVPLQGTRLFERLEGFFTDSNERNRYEKEKQEPGFSEAEGSVRRGIVEFNPGLLSSIKQIFASSVTKPNRQDYLYLLTKTFGLNLAIRLAFVIQGVTKGELPLLRAVLSTSWYQLQDAVFTVFGQTYMKFLGKMTGLIRVHRAHMGDFIFVYVQLCVFEFLNRLVLGPLGENPLVYTWAGIGLIFVNILQGMISGGPLIPAINQMRKAGVISHSTMMHLYQLASLTMHFGLFATFGYQTFYALLTGIVLVLAWSSYVVFSFSFKDPKFSKLSGEAVTRLDKLALDMAALQNRPIEPRNSGSPIP